MIDKNLLGYAINVGNKISNEYLAKGDYYPKEAWGCEGQIYPSLMGLMLLELYKIEKNELYINAVKSIIAKNSEKQMPSGGWPLSLGVVANGSKFEVSDHIKKITSVCEDLPSTATALRLNAEYQLLTGDKHFIESLERGIRYLIFFWNGDESIFNEMMAGEALKLRANPKNYQIYAYQCVESISKLYSDFSKFITPLYETIKNIFMDMNENTYPLLYALYASLIIEKEGPSDYVLTKVKKRIDNEITFGSKFIIPNVSGAMGHRDGLRGICLSEGHLRNSVGAAIVMNFYDSYVEPKIYTNTKFYSDLTSWILKMYEEGRFYEFIDLETNTKVGFGTPGQYIPLMWILNKI